MRTRLRPPATLLLSLFVVPVVLAGCADPATQESSSGTLTAAQSSAAAESTGEDPTSSDGATDAPLFPEVPQPVTTDASPGSAVTVSAIRVGRQDGFDRVVFEFGGTGTPGWDVRYVDAATSQGSGKPVDVAGDAVLQVSLTGVGYPFDTGVEEVSTRRVSSPDTEAVTEVVYDSTFEGTALAFIGTRAQEPFRAYLLENPTRVVVEVFHE